jgi:hypothetical protein
MFNFLKRFFKPKEKKVDAVQVPFHIIFRELEDGSLEIQPKILKCGNSWMEMEQGKMIIHKDDTLFRIKWHEHKGKKLACRYFKEKDGKEYVEILGFTK